MKRAKNTIISIWFFSGCVLFAVSSYAGMGGGHHGSNYGSMGGEMEMSGDSYGFGTYHGSDFNHHHQNLNNNHERSYHNRIRSPYVHPNRGTENDEVYNENGVGRYPNKVIQPRNRPVLKR